MTHTTRLLATLILALLCSLTPQLHAQTTPPSPAPAQLALSKKALLPIRIAPNSPNRVKLAAGTLAAELKRITGATFTSGEGALDATPNAAQPAIYFGLAKDFPSLPFNSPFNPESPTGPGIPAGPGIPVGVDIADAEAYLLKTHNGSLYILATTPLALEHALWDTLHRIGYRQFFPGPDWEVVPSIPNLSLSLDTFQKPSYLYRNLFYGNGSFMRPNPERYTDWAIKNRMSVADRASIVLQTGHAYASLATSLEATLKVHPEYLALVNGVRARKTNSQKFCTSNPDLQKLITDTVVARYFTRPATVTPSTPYPQSVSMDPSDLNNWCECPDCAKMGGASNQAVTLANNVAAALEAKTGRKIIVGMYAYNQHSPPPTLKVHPNVVVSVATSFIRGGFTLDQLISGWAAQGATLGIREYYAIYAWDRNLPARARSSRPAYIRDSISRFHALGARYMTAEATETWGPQGLGFYLSSRLLWDISQASDENYNALLADFFDKSFGPASAKMREFYALLDPSAKKRLSSDLVARMYTLLQDARAQAESAPNPAAVKRIDNLILYTRYIELHIALSQTSGKEARQQAWEELAPFAWRTGALTGMIDVIGLWRDTEAKDKSLTFPAECDIRTTAPKNPWKDTTPFTTAEIKLILDQGLKNNKILDFDEVSFSDDLAPATALNLTSIKNAGTSIGSGHRGRQTYFLWLDKPGDITLTLKPGLIYKDRGNVQLSLFADADESTQALATNNTTPPDGQDHTVTLKSTFSGLHRLVINDGNDRTQVTFPPDLKYTATAPHSIGRWALHFYVPKGTKRVIGFNNDDTGQVLGPDGKVLYDFEKNPAPGYFIIPVPDGTDGKLWRFTNVLGVRELLNVPPYLIQDAANALLPIEVINADK
jgi:hypothetical protein